MGPYQRTPKEVARAMRYSGLGVRSVGPVEDFLDSKLLLMFLVIFSHVFTFYGGK